MTAQQVTEELVNLFLNKNVTTRTQRAEDTTIFLSDQAKDLDKQVTTTENKIAAYKAQYKDSLPENLGLNRASLETGTTGSRGRAENGTFRCSSRTPICGSGAQSLGSADPVKRRRRQPSGAQGHACPA